MQRQFVRGRGTVPRPRGLLGHQRVRPLPLADVPPAPAPPDTTAVEPPEPPEPEPAEEPVEEPAVVVPEPAEEAAPGSAEAAPTDPKQLAALADALYPQLVRLLRHEVLLDRERRGVRTDRRLP